MKPLNGKSLDYINDIKDSTPIIAADEPQEALISICARGVSASIPLDQPSPPHLTLAKAIYGLLQDPEFCKLVIDRATGIEQAFKEAVEEKLGGIIGPKRTLN